MNRKWLLLYLLFSIFPTVTTLKERFGGPPETDSLLAQEIGASELFESQFEWFWCTLARIWEFFALPASLLIWVGELIGLIEKESH